MITAYYLFFSPQIGMADSADFARLINRLGLDRPFVDGYRNFFNFFNSKYPITGELKFPLNPGQFFGSIAILLNKWFYSENVFSIYFLSSLYVIFYLGGYHLFIKSLLDKVNFRPLKVALLVISLALFSDVMFISYFNSFYQESIFIISGLFVVALILAKERSYHWLLLAFFFLIFSKAQNLIFIVFPVFLISTKWRFLNKYFLFSGFLITAFVLFFQLKKQAETNEANLYEAVFLGLLYQADETEQKTVLYEMGLNNPHYLDNVGRGYWRDQNELYDYKLNKEFYQKVKNSTIIKMYIYNPHLFVKTAWAGLRIFNDQSAQPEHLGNLSLENSVNGSKTIVKTFLGRYLNKLILPGFVGICLFYIWRSIYFQLKREDWIAWILLVFIPFVFIANFVAGGINDFIKHNLSVYFMFSILLLLFCLKLLQSIEVHFNRLKLK